MAGMATVEVQLKRTTTNTVLNGRLPVNEEISYRIYDDTNRLVFSKSIIVINAENRLLESLDVSGLPAGNYLLHIVAEKEILQEIKITL